MCMALTLKVYFLIVMLFDPHLYLSTASFPVGYAAAPPFSPNMYPGANPAFPTGKRLNSEGHLPSMR